MGRTFTSLGSDRLGLWKDVYDMERFEEIRQIAAEMLVEPSGQPLEVVKDLFCNETGYQTPKLDTRAAIFQEDKILLVQENDGLWSLPGGWCDVDQSVKDNVVKEVKEEAGLDVEAQRVVAILDKHKNNPAKISPPRDQGLHSMSSPWRGVSAQFGNSCQWLFQSR